MGTLFTYHRCCECDQQASVMRSSGDGGPSTVAVWYCETHSPLKLPPYSMEGDSRDRFEAWFEANAKYIEPADWFQWMEAAWQAAEAQAARRCAEICDTDYYTENGWGITKADLRCAAAIRAEFPEAFK